MSEDNKVYVRIKGIGIDSVWHIHNQEDMDIIQALLEIAFNRQEQALEQKESNDERL